MSSASYYSTVLFAEDLVTFFLIPYDLHWNWNRNAPYSLTNYRPVIPTYFTKNIALVLRDVSDSFRYQSVVESSQFFERVKNNLDIIQDLKQKAESVSTESKLGIFHFCAYAAEVSVFCERNKQYAYRLTLINTIVSVLQCNFHIQSEQSWTDFDNLAIGHIRDKQIKLQERATWFANIYKASKTNSLIIDKVTDSISFRRQESIVDLNSSNANAQNFVSSSEESIKPESFISKNLESTLGLSSNLKKVSRESLSDPKNTNSKSLIFVQEASTSKTAKVLIDPYTTPVGGTRFFYSPTSNQSIFPHSSAANYDACPYPYQLDFLRFRNPDECYTQNPTKSSSYPLEVINPAFPHQKYNTKSALTNSRTFQETLLSASNQQSYENSLIISNDFWKYSTNNYMGTANELEVPPSIQKQKSSSPQFTADAKKEIDVKTPTIEEIKSSTLYIPATIIGTQCSANSNMTQSVTDNAPSFVKSSKTSDNAPSFVQSVNKFDNSPSFAQSSKTSEKESP